MTKERANKIFNILKKEYPGATTSLRHTDPLELLVATILSAQCTDKRVNIVTKTLFKKYKNVEDYAGAKPSVFEQEIRSTGFYKNKAKNILAAAKKIQDTYKSRVPEAMEELISLPGVARKTANIVLFHGYGKNLGIAVDTHVKRLSGRLDLSKNTDPVKIEQDLMKLFNKNTWGIISNLLIEHGRAVCDARRPKCPECKLSKICPSVKEFYP